MVIFSIGIGQAQEQYIFIKAKNKPEVLTPGKNYTLLFEITNTSKDTLNVNCKFEVPQEFKAVLSNKRVLLKPNSKKNVIFTFGVSRYCPSNEFNTTVSIVQNKNIIFSKGIKFDVSKIYKLDVEVLKHPEYLRLEKDFYCEYLVTNNGNSPEEIELLSKNSFKVDPELIILQPDSSAVVKVFQKVPQTQYTKTIVLNNLKAKLISYDTVFSNRIPIDLYPSNNLSPDLYRRFPIFFSTIFNSVKGSDTINVFKFRVTGGGFLDKHKEHFLSFYYSGPDQREIVRFGEYERYNMYYRNSKFEAVVGDVSFSLSNLTENSRYGLGSIVKYKFNKGEASVFYVKPRFTDKISDSYGGKLIYGFSKKAYIQFGLINRSLFENDESIKSQIYSVESSYTNDKVKLIGEVAYEHNNKTSGIAASVESYIEIKKLFFGSSVQYSDKDYKGYLRNSKQLYASLRYKISRKIKAQVSANYSAINPVNDTINYTSSPILTKYQASIYFRLNKKNKLKLGGYQRKKEDRLDPKKYDFEEKLITISYNYKKIKSYNINLRSELGSSINYLNENPSPKNVFFGTVDFSLNITKNIIAGINGTYQQTNKNSIDNELIKSFYYGGFLRYYYKSNFDVNLFYRSDYDFDVLDNAQSYLEARLNYNYRGKHILGISVSQSSLPVEPLIKELFISASYSFKLNVPLSKDRTVGSVRGKINSMENDNLEGILLLLDNNIAITNKKGEFTFYNLKPKTYILSAKRSSLPSDKIIIEEMPYKIEVDPDKESFVSLNLGKTGNLIGKVKFEKTTKVQSKKFIKKIPRLVIKISKGKLKYLTKTDDMGNFEFREISPGKWTVEILVKNITKDFTFDKIKDDIEIISNENSTIEFNVSNKNRAIKKSKKSFKL